MLIGPSIAWLGVIVVVAIFLATRGARRKAPAPPLTPGDRTVVVTACGPRKIETIKLVRAYTGLGLVESKRFVENAPQKLVQHVSTEAARAVVERFEAAGGAAEIVSDSPSTPPLL